MIKDLKNVIKHSGIYGIGNILAKAGVFFMIPVYTRYLTPADYGTLELFYTTTTVLKTFLAVGIAHATLRFFFEYEAVSERKKVISTALIATLFIGLIGTVFLFIFSGRLSSMLFGTTRYGGLFRLVAFTFLLEISIEVSLAYLRACEKSVFFISVSVLQLIARIGVSVLLLVFFGQGIKGILIGDLCGVALAWLILTAYTVRFSGISIDIKKLKEIVRYSFPLALGSLSFLVIGTSDRYIMNSFIGVGTIGLYALAYRFGTIIQALYTEPFTKSYGPYRFSIMKRTDAGVFYSRVLTYFLFGYLFLGLGVSVLSKEVIGIMAAKPFWDSYSIVPIVVLASAGGGCYYILQIGIYIQKKTRYVPQILFCSAAVNVLLNIILIPYLGATGAALAFLATNATTCVLTYLISQRLMPVTYEFGRILKLALAAVAVYMGCQPVDTGRIWLDMLLKILIVMAYPFVLWFLRFYHDDEVAFIRAKWAAISTNILRKVHQPKAY